MTLAYSLPKLLCPPFSPRTKLLLGTGLCGGFTTFSTFAVDVCALIESGRLGTAAGSVSKHAQLQSTTFASRIIPAITDSVFSLILANLPLYATVVKASFYVAGT